MTKQEEIVTCIRLNINALNRLEGMLDEELAGVEGGNLAEVYEGAKDHVVGATWSLSAALRALAPEEET